MDAPLVEIVCDQMEVGMKKADASPLLALPAPALLPLAHPQPRSTATLAELRTFMAGVPATFEEGMANGREADVAWMGETGLVAAERRRQAAAVEQAGADVPV